MPRQITDSISRARLIKNLKDDVYCRIGISKLLPDQVGVIAIRTIPTGVNPFKTPDRHYNTKTIQVTNQDLTDVPSATRQMINDFYQPDEETSEYPVNANGLNALDISFYLNHSDTPNLEVYHAPGEYYGFRTIRAVKPNEELTYRYFDNLTF
jgi:hypothetical protein